MVRLRYFLLSIFTLMSVVSLQAEDVCEDYSRWWAYLVDEPSPTNGLTENDTTYYTPSEFFGPDGGMVPDYTGSAYQTTGYYFRDTSCYTDDFVLEARLLDVTGGGYHLVFGMSVDFEPEFELDFGGNQPRPAPRNVSNKIEFSATDADKPKSPLRLDAHIVVMGFEYHDGILYFYRNGDLYKRQAMDICTVQNFYVYWVYGGGGVESIRFQDNTNGTTYFEDFKDCKNMQLIEECPPDPVVELRARYELPSCQDPTLRFYCESNVLEEFHWVGPDGKEFSTEQNPVVEDGLSAMSGTYYVWGKLHRCAEPTVVRLDLDIVPPEPVVDTIKVTTCSSDTLVIGGVPAIEDGFYRDTVRTANGLCDSVTVYDVYVLHPKTKVVYLNVCDGESVEFNGKTYSTAGSYVDVQKSKIFDCDSVYFAIRVKVFEKYFIERYDTICFGGSLDGHTETGSYVDSLTSVNGCDSVMVLHLWVLPKPKVDTIKIYSCSQDVELGGGVVVTESGLYPVALTTVAGCDSLVVYDVVIVRTQTVYVDLNLCEGDMVSYEGKDYTSGGIYHSFIKSERFECDSIIYVVNVEQYPSYFTARYDTVCWGGSVDGFTETGVYTDSLTTVNGCDSVMQLNLFVYSKKEAVLADARICEGDTLWVGDEPITESGDYEFNMGSVGKCDSFVVVRVDVDPAFSLSDMEDVYGCRRLEEQLEVDSIEGAQYQWTPVAFLSGANTRNPIVRTTTDVNYKVMVRRGKCVDSATVQVRVSPGPVIERVDLSAERGEVDIVAVGGIPEYLYALNDGMWQSSSTFWENIEVGASIAHVRDSLGCESSLPFYYLIPIYPEDHMTPNGDGIKDTWEIENLGFYKHYKVRIYDRYGKLLIEYRDFYPGWDGVYNGVDMPATDYWYVISVDELDYEISGHFTLARFDN